MNAQEFESAVRELRQLQRRFFRCKKDDADRPKALEMMREKEKEVSGVVETVMAVRPIDKMVESDREQFFLDVTLMLRLQKKWMKQGGGSWQMNPAKEAEKKVDEWLARWKEEREAEKQRWLEEVQKRQLTIF